MKIHQIKIDFNVTENVKRYVYVYLIEGKNCYLIDSGVNGSEKIIEKYILETGRRISEIKGILITHTHPDHIGTAAYFKEKTNCKIYTSEGEMAWIENIDLQYRKRPIPNFYNIAGKSAKVDVIVRDGDTIKLDDEISVNVIGTPGHSSDEVSYRINDAIFVGDSIPIKGDIPIYIDKDKSMKSLEKLSSLNNIKYCYPAWDKIYTYKQMTEKCNEAAEMIKNIDCAVKSVMASCTNINKSEIIKVVCDKLNLPLDNKLIETTIESHLNCN